MIALLQRVSHAEVTVEGKSVGAIGAGLLVLVGVRPSDDESERDAPAYAGCSVSGFPDEAGQDELELDPG